jgi:hypothetical protein
MFLQTKRAERKLSLCLFVFLITTFVLVFALPAFATDGVAENPTSAMIPVAYAGMALGGVALPTLIQVAVGLAKKLGFPTTYCPHLAAGLGLIGGIAVSLIGGQPIYYGIVAGIMLGALACGIYDASQGSKSNTSSFDISNLVNKTDILKE